ncbi:hypothetical protein Cyrtocomes_00804 [Candidatus Cyrtobacter comes]|uniref:Uncharacterized protein n=1 Tax=Candidatus Cyrtobacter comes TaxID=675776 RepID=A0ABU5L8H6_9RICK|nr:hypothetical protein [Candidatus Cyrtobacter comes]MDZ5762422.1 hypothetical protein [Candidatus Cyrtobacter comes]
MSNSVNDVKELFKRCDSFFGMRFDVLELKKLVSHGKKDDMRSEKYKDFQEKKHKSPQFSNINVEFFSDEVKTVLSALIKDAVKEALSEVLKEKKGNT